MNSSYLILFSILATLSIIPSQQPDEKELTLEYKRGRNHIRRRSKIVAPTKEAAEESSKKEGNRLTIATRTPEDKLQ